MTSSSLPHTTRATKPVSFGCRTPARVVCDNRQTVGVVTIWD